MISNNCASLALSVDGSLPVKTVSSLQHMDTIYAPNVDAVIWTRKLPETVEQWLGTIPHEQLPEGRFVLKPADVSSCMEMLFCTAGIEPCLAQTWLSNDMSELAHLVSEAMDAPQVRLRLEAVSDNACSKFHIDTVVSRLICTYRGPGTQVGVTKEGEDPIDIQTVATGMPILLKGKLWPKASDLTLRHRSPPIADTGLSRLVLVLEGVTSETRTITPYDQIFSPR